MNKPLKLIAIGNSTGVVIPKDVLTRLRVSRGDQLTLVETPDGFKVQAFDADFARQMDMAEEIMRKDRDILRELAK